MVSFLNSSIGSDLYATASNMESGPNDLTVFQQQSQNKKASKQVSIVKNFPLTKSTFTPQMFKSVAVKAEPIQAQTQAM